MRESKFVPQDNHKAKRFNVMCTPAIVLTAGQCGLPTTTLAKKKRTIFEICGEKNAVPRVISCSITREQRRAKVADSRGSDLALRCHDRA